MNAHSLRIFASVLRMAGYALILIHLGTAVAAFIVSEVLEMRAELKDEEAA